MITGTSGSKARYRCALVASFLLAFSAVHAATPIHEQVRSLIAEKYGAEGFDPQAWLKTTATDTQVATLLRRLDDPAVRLLPEAAAARFMAQMQSGPPAGLGLIELLCVDIGERTRRLTVVTAIPETPAAAAGLRSGDIISRIDSRPTDGVPLHEAVGWLHGEPGSVVRLLIERAGKDSETTLTRAGPPENQSVVRSMQVKVGSRSVAYVGILRFVPGAAAEVEKAVRSALASNVAGVVLDLRNNPGGAITEAVSVSGLFLQADTEVARLRSRSALSQTLRTQRAPAFDGPLVVLQNFGSASAAEVLAGALQAAGRAKVIGERSFGKGLVHAGERLADDSLLLIPVGRLITPHGVDILNKGVQPDRNRVDDGTPVLHGSQGSEADPLFNAALELLAFR